MGNYFDARRSRTMFWAEEIATRDSLTSSLFTSYGSWVESGFYLNGAVFTGENVVVANVDSKWLRIREEKDSRGAFRELLWHNCAEIC